jgi:hypothetical protein
VGRGEGEHSIPPDRVRDETCRPQTGQRHNQLAPRFCGTWEAEDKGSEGLPGCEQEARRGFFREPIPWMTSVRVDDNSNHPVPRVPCVLRPESYGNGSWELENGGTYVVLSSLTSSHFRHIWAYFFFQRLHISCFPLHCSRRLTSIATPTTANTRPLRLFAQRNLNPPEQILNDSHRNVTATPTQSPCQ